VKPVTKKSNNVKRIPVDAVGAIYHTTEQHTYYFYIPLWKKDLNLIITILSIIAALTVLRERHPPVL
jgi:Mg2+/Co2+ transporter CorB